MLYIYQIKIEIGRKISVTIRAAVDFGEPICGRLFLFHLELLCLRLHLVLVLFVSWIDGNLRLLLLLLLCLGSVLATCPALLVVASLPTVFGSRGALRVLLFVVLAFFIVRITAVVALFGLILFIAILAVLAASAILTTLVLLASISTITEVVVVVSVPIVVISVVGILAVVLLAVRFAVVVATGTTTPVSLAVIAPISSVIALVIVGLRSWLALDICLLLLLVQVDDLAITTLGSFDDGLAMLLLTVDLGATLAASMLFVPVVIVTIASTASTTTTLNTGPQSVTTILIIIVFASLTRFTCAFSTVLACIFEFCNLEVFFVNVLVVCSLIRSIPVLLVLRDFVVSLLSIPSAAATFTSALATLVLLVPSSTAVMVVVAISLVAILLLAVTTAPTLSIVPNLIVLSSIRTVTAAAVLVILIRMFPGVLHLIHRIIFSDHFSAVV